QSASRAVVLLLREWEFRLARAGPLPPSSRRRGDSAMHTNLRRSSAGTLAALTLVVALTTETRAAPTITKIEGPNDNVTVVKGRISATVGTNYNLWLVIAEPAYAASYRLTIYGSGFGTVPGQVKFGSRVVTVMKNGWKDNAI